MLQDALSPQRASRTDAPPKRVTERVFDSFLDLEAGLSGWEQLYRQITPGAFRGGVLSSEWHNVTLSREDVNRGMDNMFRMPENSASFCFPLRAKGTMERENVDFGRGDCALLFSGQDHHCFQGPGSRTMIVTVPDSLFRFTSKSKFKHLRGNQVLSTAQWLETLLISLRSGHAAPSLVDLAPDLIIDRLSLLLEADTPANQTSRASTHTVRKIVELCQDMPPATLSVQRLSETLGIDRPTLRAAIRDHTDFSLDDLLRGIRMSEVHRRLRRGDPDSDRVSDISMEFGYSHWGRFASAYRDMFGERPSETLKRPAIC